MCNISGISHITSIIYLILCIIIPILYYLYYRNKKSKKKNYTFAFFIMVLLFLVLFIPKIIIANFYETSCINCIMNNKCVKNKEENNEENMTTTNSTKKVDKISTTIKTTTTTTEKTTEKKDNSNKTYEKVKEIEGERKDIGVSDKGYTIYTINGVTYIDGYMIVNKTYTVDESFVPTDTYESSENKTNTCNTCINNTVYKAWKEMSSDAAALGLNIKITSGYRPYKTQETIYNRYVSRDGQEKADTYSARPGSSEHQTGLCFDLNSISDAFANTNEGVWVNNNAYKYGFIIRYPKGKNDETGYKYESWHLRYVGTDLSYKLYNNGNWISMESYFGITSRYSD